MKIKLCIAALLLCLTGAAQELFTFTEPASNMAAKSIGLRLNNYIVPERYTSKTDYHLIPEVMFGVSKKVMVHGDAFFSNRSYRFTAEGGSVYAKYRFLSKDEVQQHFRMSLFGRYSINNSIIEQEEINLYGYNSGFEGGVVATQLLHKTALSSALSFVKATGNSSGNKFPEGSNSKALNYTLSAGRLVLPKVYTDYKQTNLNLMLELLSQLNLGSGKYYIDAAPSVQFIFNSVARMDIGYRTQLSHSLLRTSPNGLFVRLEYNLFNAY